VRTLRVSYRRTRDFGRRMGSTPTMGTSCHSVLRAYASHNIYNDLDRGLLGFGDPQLQSCSHMHTWHIS